jgi:chemotaxis protein MotB
MRRRKKQGHVSQDRWLISYSDFITLLFAFFVVLFATGQSQKKKQQLAYSIHSAFSQMGIFDAHSKVPPLSEASGGGNSAVALPADASLTESPEQTAKNKVIKQLQEAAQPEIDRGVVRLRETPDGLVISLQESGFFDSGAAEIRSSALPVFDRVATALPDTALRVEGHTDDVPIHTERFASNWELSSGRASSIARLLLLHGNVHAEKLSVAGYAEFHPEASNDSPEGRARNRRVDIVILNGSR